MKLLKVTCNNFLLCEKDFTINFMPVGNKTEDDKEFELEEIDNNLFVFNTIGIVGKNASGKTMTLNLLRIVYDIITNYRIKTSESLFIYIDKPFSIDITFYHDKYIYNYKTTLEKITSVTNNTIVFKNQKLYRRLYKPTHIRNLFDLSKYEEVENNNSFPDDVSIIYSAIKDTNENANTLFYSSEQHMIYYINGIFGLYSALDNSNIMKSILNMFDSHLEDIKMIDDDNYKIVYKNGNSEVVSQIALINMLSSGTSKGLTLFAFVVYSLHLGCDLVIDEIENHFHRSLIENLINLYKDKNVNKKHATLIFTTHNAELLDLFNRDDNIYISKYNKNIKLENVYDYHIRPELLRSKKFYENAFDTAVDYEALMEFKKELM